jgi:hypothetical protein
MALPDQKLQFSVKASMSYFGDYLGWTGIYPSPELRKKRASSGYLPCRSKAVVLKSRMSELDMSGAGEGLGRVISPVYSTTVRY